MRKYISFIEKFKIPQVAVPYLPQLFSIDEIALVENMVQDVFNKEDVKILLCNISDDFLRRCYKRGVVSIVDENYQTYKISKFYNWLDIFVVSRKEEYNCLPKEVINALDDWYFQAYEHGLDQNFSLPPTHDEILPIQEVLDFIDRQDRPIFLNYCDCRSLRGDCGLPKKTCITYKNGINTFVHRGLSEKIDKERAKQVVLQAEKDGLMHTVNPNGICNCCGDCCYLFRAQNNRQSKGIWPKAHYVIFLNPKDCIGCGRCLNRCHFNVFKKDGQQVTTQSEKCVGCGICVSTCPTHALELEAR